MFAPLFCDESKGGALRRLYFLGFNRDNMKKANLNKLSKSRLCRIFGS